MAKFIILGHIVKCDAHVTIGNQYLWNELYSMVYFDENIYEKINFENVAFLELEILIL